MEGINVDQLTHRVLEDMNKDMCSSMKGDCIFINCGMYPPLDDVFRIVIENVLDDGSDSKHLIVMLETNGGYMETVERLVSVMRTHYKKVSFIIPNYAFSAGTVLALSGDSIYMDYYSVLGPIDPQYEDPEGKQLLPGVGYLAKYKELTETINAPNNKNKTAELAYLVNNFDPGRLFHIEQAINHGRTLIKEWLPKYKFKDWKETKSRGKKVTETMKTKRADKIATVLGDARKWHSHGRGITMNELSGAAIKLEINDFGENSQLNSLIRNYHGLCVDYYSHKSGIRGYIHSSQGMRRVP